MELRLKFYHGGSWNPYIKDEQKAYEKVIKEKEVKPDVLTSQLDAWPLYVAAHSKAVFWELEKYVAQFNPLIATSIWEMWERAKQEGRVGEWLFIAEGEESEKSLLYYLATKFAFFCPSDNTVEFKLYLTEPLPPRVREENNEMTDMHLI